jgi:hypothetical protein
VKGYATSARIRSAKKQKQQQHHHYHLFGYSESSQLDFLWKHEEISKQKRGIMKVFDQ